MRSGILLLDKPRGLSSNAALQRVRRLLGGPKAGHAGSLDPLATGMLPICVGEATKIAGDIVSGLKCYRFGVTLGTRTASGDAEGEVVASAAVPALTREAVEARLGQFLGRQSQVPPMYSALKLGGQPLYRLARAGLTVERAPRDIEIFGLTLLGSAAGTLDIEARCSKGTYIRVLAEDIAVALGTFGYVTALRRMWVEPFEGDPMSTLESLEAAAERGELPPLLPPDRPLGHLPAVQLARSAVQRLRQGQTVPAAAPGALSAARLRLYDEHGGFLGIGAAQGAEAVRPVRLLAPEDLSEKGPGRSA